jgi:hypothetical protein
MIDPAESGISFKNDLYPFLINTAMIFSRRFPPIKLLNPADCPTI